MPIKKLFYTLLKSIGVSFYHQNTLTLVTCPVKLKFRLSKILSDLN